MATVLLQPFQVDPLEVLPQHISPQWHTPPFSVQVSCWDFITETVAMSLTVLYTIAIPSGRSSCQVQVTYPFFVSLWPPSHHHSTSLTSNHAVLAGSTHRSLDAMGTEHVPTQVSSVCPPARQSTCPCLNSIFWLGSLNASVGCSEVGFHLGNPLRHLSEKKSGGWRGFLMVSASLPAERVRASELGFPQKLHTDPHRRSVPGVLIGNDRWSFSKRQGSRKKDHPLFDWCQYAAWDNFALQENLDWGIWVQKTKQNKTQCHLQTHFISVFLSS